MGKRNSHSFQKYQKELKRKKRAKEKLERRQGKKEQATQDDKQEFPDQTTEKPSEGYIEK